MAKAKNKQGELSRPAVMAQAHYDDLLDAMSPALRRRYDEIERRRAVAREWNLREYHWLGTVILEIQEDADAEYGSGATEKLAAALEESKFTIYKSSAFARTYDTKKKLDDLCALCMTNGRMLGWGHVVALLSVDDSEKRIELQEQVVAESLTAEDLSKAIAKKFKRKSGASSSQVQPKTVPGRLRQIKNTSENWLDKHVSEWAPTKGYLEQAEKLPPDSYTEEMLEDLREISNVHAEMEVACSETYGRVSKLIDQVEGILRYRDEEDEKNEDST